MADMRKLRILAIGFSSSTHVASRVKCFAERGHDVYLLTDRVRGLDGVKEIAPSAPPEQDRWVTQFGLWAAKIVRRDLTAVSDMARLLLDFRRKVKAVDPDIVHVHYAYNTWAWMAVALGMRPLVVSVMGGDVLFEEQGSPTPRGISLTKRLLAAADVITSKSNFLIGILDDLGGYGAKATRVVWGVDPEVFRPFDGAAMRAVNGIPANARVVLSPKILTPFYNIHVLVEAMAKVVAQVPAAHLVLTEYGADPVYKEQLLERLDALGLMKAVTFVGHVVHSEMPQFYALADVVVGIPLSDGLPQTLLEAMSCGVPSVIGPLDRYNEIVRDGESALFAQIDPGAVADAILRLLQNDGLRRNMAARGREIVVSEANFPLEVRRVEEIYERLAGQRCLGRRLNLRMLKDIVLYWLRR